MFIRQDEHHRYKMEILPLKGPLKLFLFLFLKITIAFNLCVEIIMANV